MLLMTTLAIQLEEQMAVAHAELDIRALQEEFAQGLMRLYGISSENIMVEVRKITASKGQGPFHLRNKRREENPHTKG